MYVQNFEIIKTRLFKCNSKLAEYIKERNIPVLHSKNGIYHFVYTDLLKEIVENIPKELRKEEFSIE